eukprot:2963730-Prymnesium_polylepis.1
MHQWLVEAAHRGRQDHQAVVVLRGQRRRRETTVGAACHSGDRGARPGGEGARGGRRAARLESRGCRYQQSDEEARHIGGDRALVMRGDRLVRRRRWRHCEQED